MFVRADLSCRRALLRWLIFIGVMAVAPYLIAQTAAPEKTRNDYAKAENWLCRPGRNDACAVDLTATVVAADGKLTREKFHAATDAAIDCFYVYPTVSMEPTPNADMAIGAEELGIVRVQFARFTSVCRPFAPLYRQMTIAQLRKAMNGTGDAGDQAMAYGDVLDAFHHYLKNDNHGRGIVLIGHSQGSGQLTKLLQEEFDGKPLAQQLVSAILAGTHVTVQSGKDVGGTFKSIPLCRVPGQADCVIVYNSYRATSPPAADGYNGDKHGPDQVDACVNPAGIASGAGELKPYLVAHERGFGNTLPAQPWLKGGPDVDTPFVEVPGMLTAECTSNANGSYLAVSVHADPAGARANDISGDVVTHGQLRPKWGLHVIDMELAMGNLIDAVIAQTHGWQHAHSAHAKH